MRFANSHVTAATMHHSIRRLFLASLWLAACGLISPASWVCGADKADLTFERDIRPIFRAHCFDCHGSQAEVEGGLDLRLVRFLKKGGDSGPAIVPGQPAKSHLLQRVRKGEMPPQDGHLTPDEIDILHRWIAAGAPTARPEPKTVPAGLGITPEEREFWAFQAIQRPTVLPEMVSSRVRNPIDAFLLARMPEGLAFAPEADRLTLIKRLYLGLTGLPPSVESLEHWSSISHPQWYEQLIDELLNSPHYGERWARHWLDVAGYADSEGYTNSDAVRPWAWKYRDWVIGAINQDLPFDEFLIHQLAGDELAGPRQGDLTSQQIRLLTATGFLRMAADGTGSGADNPEARNKVVADTIRIVTSSLLGISVGCAQCHDHRYDPIPQTDYYALRAVFEPALDWQSWKQPSGRLVSLYTQADRELSSKIESEAKQVLDEKNKKQAVYMQQALDKELQKYEEPLRDQLRQAYKTAGDKRSDAQKKLLKQHPSVNISPGVLYQYLPKAAEELKGFDKRAAEIRARKPKEEFIRALIEKENHSPVTYLFHRGDHRQPKQAVEPAGLTVVSPAGQRQKFPSNDPNLKTTGRRLAFARWLTSGQHRLVPRVIVNRIWMHHFGQGIVPTPSDFGRLGTKPTHPQLLDWLAHEFVRRQWSLKELHRLILTSTAFRQSSYRNPGQAAIDPSNRFYARKSITRLEAEAVRDRMLAVSGNLDSTCFGPPLAIKKNDSGQIVVDGDQKRRSLYIQVRRSQPLGMLQAFDAPVMEVNCEKRPVSTVATQSLILMNGDFTLKQARALAARAEAEARPIPQELLDRFPALPQPAASPWSYGYCKLPAADGPLGPFQPLPHWTGSAWQGGPKLPDPTLGWVTLHANGGHPDSKHAAIRRWTAPVDGQVVIQGKLHHGSKQGNGVRARVIHRQTENLGTWTAHHTHVETPVATVQVRRGDTIDLVTDSLGTTTSDSFTWQVRLTLKRDGQADATFKSQTSFLGPSENRPSLLSQVVRAWQLALGRTPTVQELNVVNAFLNKQLTFLNEHPEQQKDKRTPTQQVLTNLCQSLLNSNEFLYID